MIDAEDPRPVRKETVVVHWECDRISHKHKYESDAIDCMLKTAALRKKGDYRTSKALHRRERAIEIVRIFLDGTTIPEICAIHRLSAPTVRSILRRPLEAALVAHRYGESPDRGEVNWREIIREADLRAIRKNLEFWKQLMDSYLKSDQDK